MYNVQYMHRTQTKAPFGNEWIGTPMRPCVTVGGADPQDQSKTMLLRTNPHPILADYVKQLWFSSRDFQVPHDSFELLPDSYVELAFSFGNGLRLDTGSAVIDLPRSYIIGLSDKPVRLRSEGIVQTVAARFFAWGAFALLDVQPDALARFDAGSLANDIERALREENAESALAHLHNFLIERALNIQFNQKEIQAASQILVREKGQVKVGDLADYCHYSPRQFERKFKRAVGRSPKALARQIRFQRVRDGLTHDPAADLNTLAQEQGYADQAHMSREFKQFSDKTPKQFATEMRTLREVLRTHYHVVFLQD